MTHKQPEVIHAITILAHVQFHYRVVKVLIVMSIKQKTIAHTHDNKQLQIA